jgi:chromosome segregation ATPase
MYDDIEIVVKWKEDEKDKLLSFLEGVMVMEDLLKRIIESQDRTEKRLIEGQDRTEKRLIEIQDKTEKRLIEIQNRTERTENQLLEIQNQTERTENQLIEIQDRTEKQFANIQNDLHTLKSDVRDIKESVHRIEEHQEESIMSSLTFMKKQNEVKNSQIQVLNKRLFEVESKVEETQKT